MRDMHDSKKYGMWKGQWVSGMSREELLELVLHLGEENTRLQNKPCIHDLLTSQKKPE